MSENKENVPDDYQSEPDPQLAYKIGFINYLLETDPEILQKYTRFVLAYQDAQLDMIAVLMEARDLIDPNKNKNNA